MTAQAVTEMLKSIKAEYGLPTCIISDNGPCYALEYFAAEMHKLRIQHIATSPHHNQSNGLAEVYVKITKHILQKAKDTSEDPHLAMMVYQTTFLGPDHPSPMEILHGCKAWSNLPLANAALKAKGLIHTAVESTKIQHNTDNQLKAGQWVMFKTPPEKTWRKAVVLKNLGHRSYKICAEDNTMYRCTRFHLKPCTSQSALATPSPLQAPPYCRPSRTVCVPKWMDL